MPGAQFTQQKVVPSRLGPLVVGDKAPGQLDAQAAGQPP